MFSKLTSFFSFATSASEQPTLAENNLEPDTEGSPMEIADKLNLSFQILNDHSPDEDPLNEFDHVTISFTYGDLSTSLHIRDLCTERECWLKIFDEEDCTVKITLDDSHTFIDVSPTITRFVNFGSTTSLPTMLVLPVLRDCYKQWVARKSVLASPSNVVAETLLEEYEVDDATSITRFENEIWSSLQSK